MTFRPGTENVMWAGDAATYFSRHSRVKRWRGSASKHLCTKCGKPARDWAQLHGTDGLNAHEDYTPMCRSCHLRYDRIGKDNAHANRTKYVSGPAVGGAKLTWEQVAQIRERHAAGGVTYVALGREFGVSSGVISNVVRGKTYMPRDAA